MKLVDRLDQRAAHGAEQFLVIDEYQPYPPASK
jgi:hypothetical protein